MDQLDRFQRREEAFERIVVATGVTDVEAGHAARVGEQLTNSHGVDRRIRAGGEAQLRQVVAHRVIERQPALHLQLEQEHRRVCLADGAGREASRRRHRLPHCHVRDTRLRRPNDAVLQHRQRGAGDTP